MSPADQPISEPKAGDAMVNKIGILVVDDDKAALQILSKILQKRGYKTDTAETGREAEEKIGSTEYEAALIDVKLPDTDGLELMNKMHLKKPQMVKILMTGFPSMENGIKAIDGGADAYLVKPVSTQDLIKILEEKLKSKKRT